MDVSVINMYFSSETQCYEFTVALSSKIIAKCFRHDNDINFLLFMNVREI